MTKGDVLCGRKGAAKSKDIPAEVRMELNKGTIESVNLTEWLAVDHLVLLQHVLSDYPVLLQACENRLGKLQDASVRTWVLEISKTLLSGIKEAGALRLFAYLARHPSDSVRCWAVYMVGMDHELSINEQFKAISPFAADTHFGVRELAWMAMRETIETHLLESIRILMDWTNSADENIRRFTTEATRPRGVWCKHLKVLTAQPELAMGLLEALKADSSPYVQLSIGNWLNDAGKSRPDWLVHVCKSWLAESSDQHTLKIVKRATRNISFQF